MMLRCKKITHMGDQCKVSIVRYGTIMSGQGGCVIKHTIARVIEKWSNLQQQIKRRKKGSFTFTTWYILVSE